VDLRAAAALAGRQGSWADEEALWNCMAQQHKVVLTPGERQTLLLLPSACSLV
jgi:hypothetical protein